MTLQGRPRVEAAAAEAASGDCFSAGFVVGVDAASGAAAAGVAQLELAAAFLTRQVTLFRVRPSVLPRPDIVRLLLRRRGGGVPAAH